ncbi:hypothetical protein MPTK1_8g02020 [Marchantia polymorpha subsp. ruderalis]|uniref:ZZ-type domain-containing protein n=2 Tax=Marchantia polymorpha TaxID=3197 RepID=A0A176WHP3_MARPO|nr:hypothetical protein AXG93_3556s1180 [Marchantia polymorpha subsp. ruderalis]PTQ46018.1 hypothetical protein MARPO_0012s0001 [Marchantia polymorpha]BBN18368.1 hypothetical protein Mp_8g02020 [Marchantia polymorpha subsp. ruderalis]|eukprot:PTQ46018.1 hypothetical protein MARPO_0012s0001 [Marchantia polymorpha]
MNYRKFAAMKFSEYCKQAPVSEDTASQLAELQPPNGVNLGHPWIHTGFNCNGCSASPITGFLYKCQKRKDYYLCETCYRKQPSDEIQEYLRIERAASSPPFQIYCVQCDVCGVAPIQGPRYRHKTRRDSNLCAACYGMLQSSKVAYSHTEAASCYELLEETTIKSARKMHSTVFHYGIKCDGCKSSPICGPRYSLKFDQEGLFEGKSPTEVNLCLVCFDGQYNSGNHKDYENHKEYDHRATGRKFRRILRPEGRSAVHVEMLSCRHCNATPICGPAYLHLSSGCLSSTSLSSPLGWKLLVLLKLMFTPTLSSKRKDNEALCLFCYMNLKPEKQEAYMRLEPPTQLSPAMGNITEEEVKSYLARRKPTTKGEEELLEAAMAAQKQHQFRHRLFLNQVKHNLRISQEIENWKLRIENDDGSWSWAYP